MLDYGYELRGGNMSEKPEQEYNQCSHNECCNEPLIDWLEAEVKKYKDKWNLTDKISTEYHTQIKDLKRKIRHCRDRAIELEESLAKACSTDDI